MIDKNTTGTLQAVQEVGNVRFQAIILDSAGNRPEPAVATKGRNPILEASINLYGEPSLAKKVGRLLTERRQFLQHPDSVDVGISYENPHYFMAPGITTDLSESIGRLCSAQKSADMVSLEIGKILESLDVVDTDIGLPTSNDLLTPLLRYRTVFLHFQIDANSTKATRKQR